MFTKIIAALDARIAAKEQQKLDTLRYHNAADPLMQLHCDRMQTALNAKFA